MLNKILKTLDKWIETENKKLSKDNLLLINKCIIKVLGQSALIEAKVNLNLFLTMDVDAYIEAEFKVQEKFNELLLKKGKHYDIYSSEIWMPQETEYISLYQGINVKAYYSAPEYVLFSKALKAPLKNKNLIVEYLSKNPSKTFFDLSNKYKLNLDQFLK